MTTPFYGNDRIESHALTRLLDEREKLKEALTTRETLHDEIEQAVRARGVLDGQSDAEQLVFSIHKLGEETDEFAYALFAGDLRHAREELADLYVVVARAERLIERLSGEPFDVAQAALEKARKDVARGAD